MKPHLQKLVDAGVIAVDAEDTVRLTQKTAWRTMTHQPALHFVGFKDDRVFNALKTFGRPDFWQRFWDHRAVAEIGPRDVVVFASGDETMAPTEYAFDDSAMQ